MKLDLMPNMVVNTKNYSSNKSWTVYTGAPSHIFQYMKVIITHPIQNERGQWKMTKSMVKVVIYEQLDEVIEQIIDYIKSIQKETGHFFDRRCYLTSLILDTDTMEATTSWSA